MESIIYKIIRHLHQEMPELATIDEDYGQLENLTDERSDMYPLSFPAVLVENTDIQWSDISGRGQKGEATIRVRLIIDCYDDTHAGCQTEDAVQQREDMRSRLHWILQGFRPMDDGSLVRHSSRFFTFKHGIKVYETTYASVVTEASQRRRSDARPRVSIDVATL